MTTLACLTSNNFIIAQPLTLPYIGTGAYSLLQNDVFSFNSNQASLAQIKNSSAGIFSERRFLLKETSFYKSAFAFPSKLGNFGITLGYDGFANFAAHQLGLAYARSLGSRMDAGIQFNYDVYSIPGYGASGTVSAATGIIFHFTEKFHGGFHAENLFAAHFSGAEKEHKPSIYSAGFGYDASPIFFTGMEIIKEEDQPITVCATVQYEWMKQFFARMGFESGTSSFFVGAGVSYHSIRFDVSAAFHPQLGISPGLMLLMDFEKSK